MIPGEFIINNKEILCNKSKKITIISVINTSERPIQVGSHFHFFEVNRKLKFDRKRAFGRRLNAVSGTGIRFEPGEKKEIELIDIGGEKEVYGFNDLTCGKANNPIIKDNAFRNALENGFMERGE